MSSWTYFFKTHFGETCSVFWLGSSSDKALQLSSRSKDVLIQVLLLTCQRKIIGVGTSWPWFDLVKFSVRRLRFDSFHLSYIINVSGPILNGHIPNNILVWSTRHQLPLTGDKKPNYGDTRSLWPWMSMHHVTAILSHVPQSFLDLSFVLVVGCRDHYVSEICLIGHCILAPKCTTWRQSPGCQQLNTVLGVKSCVRVCNLRRPFQVVQKLCHCLLDGLLVGSNNNRVFFFLLFFHPQKMNLQ